MGSDLHFTQLIRQTSTFTVGENQSIVRTYSLHIRARAFAVFCYEPVEPRGDNGQRYRAELEHVECADVEFETRSFPNLLVATLATLP